jgi:type I restriction enzyme R subunit
MAKRHAPPELTFQEHIADYLVREHGYGVLEQAEITDTENAIAEDHLWTFLCATQAETVKRLQEDYGTDARDEIFRALRKAIKAAPLWMILRHGLTVRGLEFKLYIPRPRSSASAAHAAYPQNRITFRPHFYFGGANIQAHHAA